MRFPERHFWHGGDGKAEIEKLLALPEDKIDIGLAALTFAHDAYPDDTDIQAYSRRIDQLAQEVRTVQRIAKANHTAARNSTDDTVLALSAVFFKDEGFTYDHSPEAMTNALNYFLPGTIEKKKGICSTLPMLYMAIGQRLGLPVYAVETPRHNFVRIADPHSQFRNIEVTSAGAPPDAWYIAQEHLTDTAITRGTYMRPITHHQYLAVLLGINASYWQYHGQEERAINYYKKAMEIDPQSPTPVLSLMQLYFNKSMKAADDLMFTLHGPPPAQIADWYNKALTYRIQADKMGIRIEDYLGENSKPVDPDAKTQ